MLKTIIWIVVSLIVIIFIIGFVIMTRGMGLVKKVELKGIDLSEIPDGIYNGHFEGSRWTNSVEVTVKDNKITGIIVTGPPLFVDDNFNNMVIKGVLEKQSLDIDVVSGASVTTKAILKSIENALTGKQE